MWCFITVFVFISVEDLTEQEFARALTQCKFSKSPGIDTSRRAEIMHFAGSDVQNRQSDICNKVLNGHSPPWQWKTNIIIPIPKKSTSQRMEDFRGITLMSVTAKIYNRMLLNRIYEPVNALLCAKHAGFR